MLLDDGADLQLVQNTLANAFTIEELRRLLRFKLNQNLDRIAFGEDYDTVLFRVLGKAESEWWTHQLILSAHEMKPNNGDLLALAEYFSLAPTNTPNRSNLEKLIQASNSFLDIATWRSALGLLESQVCSILINNQHAGTGFLLGSDVVMTNYHVMESVIKQTPGHEPDKVLLRFDYKMLSKDILPKLGDNIQISESWISNNQVTNEGVTYTLAEDWLVDSSQYSPFDLRPMPKGGTPSTDQLDYALLRTAKSPGNDAVGGSGDPQAPKRGWMKPVENHNFLEKKAIFIAQHPMGAPLKLALDTEAVTQLNENQTRVFYRTNTEPGSSGSPCFDENWNLVALHHAGDPNSLMPAWNEGIPFGPIMALLRSRGKDKELGEKTFQL
ncbi:MAG: trypsin-like peptidase domain-containing protein [Chloroflexota bacterium]